MGIWYGVASEFTSWFTWRPCGIMHVESHNNNNTTERTRAVLEALNECACDALSVHYDAHACSAGPEGRLACGRRPHSHLLNTQPHLR